MENLRLYRVGEESPYHVRLVQAVFIAAHDKEEAIKLASEIDTDHPYDNERKEFTDKNGKAVRRDTVNAIHPSEAEVEFIATLSDRAAPGALYTEFDQRFL